MSSFGVPVPRTPWTLAVCLLLAIPPLAAAGLSPTEKCVAEKLKANAKRYTAKLKCHQRALGAALDAACLAKAEEKFAASYAKADATGACAGGAAAQAAEVDACVALAVDGVSATTTTTVTVPTTTTLAGEPAALEGITDMHNAVRAGVGVGPLTWSPALAATAQAWAEQCQDTVAPLGVVDHNPNRSSGHPYYVGENVYGGGTTISSQQAVNTWAAEAAHYNYAANQCAGVCSHYLQVVWAASQELGCGWALCPGLTNGATIVCNYGPGMVGTGRPY